MIRIFEFDALKPEEILNRDIRAEASVEATVDAIIADVRARGDAALKDYALKFDHAQLDELRVSQAEIDEAFEAAGEDFVTTLKMAAGSDTDVGIYVLESASDSEYTLSKEELALVDMEDFYIELRADGTGETYMEDFVTFQWKDGSFYALTDPDTPAMTYTREGDLLTIEFDGMTMVFKRSDTKPEIDPALLEGGEDEYDGDGWIDGPDEPDPPYTYDDGNTYDDLGNTNWYGWFRMENYKNVPNRDYFDTDTYDCWGYIGESDDGSHYFEVYRDGMPDDPVITMWVNVYDDHIEPILDGYDWVLDQNITESDAYKFNLYPYNDSISLFMYDYEGDDGTACAVSFYMRLDGTEWNEELEELPPRYEEYKAALANK